MFERFTERARQVIVLAQDDARMFNHGYIGTEHLLLGLIRNEEGLASRVLVSLGITVEGVRTEVVRIVGQGNEVTTGQIPFTPRAKKVLELALREGLSLGHNYVGTEHILLGLVREDEGVAARILLEFDADANKVRNQTIRMLSGPGRRQAGADSTLGATRGRNWLAAPAANVLRQIVELCREEPAIVEAWVTGISLFSPRELARENTGLAILLDVVAREQFDDLAAAFAEKLDPFGPAFGNSNCYFTSERLLPEVTDTAIKIYAC
jgi:hypothetical protein